LLLSKALAKWVVESLNQLWGVRYGENAGRFYQYGFKFVGRIFLLFGVVSLLIFNLKIL